jgi:integrase
MEQPYHSAVVLKNIRQLFLAGNRSARDRALLLVAYDTMCRRSELVSLLIEDIRYSENNGVTMASVLIKKSKTDQLAKGRRLNLSQKSNEAINLCLERLRHPKEG